MRGYFEDSNSLEYTGTPEQLFYCFYSSTMKNDLPIESHWHFYIEVLYGTKGNGQLVVNGQSLTFNQGDLFFVLPKDVHSISAYEHREFEYAVIKFDPKLLFDTDYEELLFKEITPIVYPIDPEEKFFHKECIPNFLAELIESTMELSAPLKCENVFLIKSNLFKLFHFFIQSLENKEGYLSTYALSSDGESAILDSYRYIHQHFHEPITAREVAEYCHLSYTYFSRQFKKISGIAFVKYLNFVRVTEAERLLLTKQFTVTEIGYMVGFTDTSYFIKQFKEMKRITPKQFVIATEK